MTTRHDATLDTIGLLCPEPVMMLHNRIADVAVGGVLKVLATDPSTERDIPRFCEFMGHQLIERKVDGDQYLYFIERRA